MKNGIVIACQSCGYLIKDIANAYADTGYDVILLTSRNSQNSIKSSLRVGIKMKSVIAYNKTSSLKRVFTWGICALQMLYKIGFCYRYCGYRVLYVSNPPLAPLLPLVLRNKFSVLIWDIYPDVLVNQHVISKDNFIARWWGNANKKVYKRAEHVFTISDGMKNCLSQYVDADRIKVIPLWPDNTNLQRVDKQSNLFIKQNHLEGKFIVMYSGNMGNTHRMDVLVDVAKQITDEEIVFVLIGEGGKKKLIEKRISDENVKNVLLFPYQPYDFLSHSLSAADLAVITLDSVSSQMSVPSKTFNMMSLGKPLLCIASPDSELGAIVKTYDVGKIFPPEDVVGMTDFVLTLKSDEIVKNQYSNNSLEASKSFNVENAKLFLA